MAKSLKFMTYLAGVLISSIFFSRFALAAPQDGLNLVKITSSTVTGQGTFVLVDGKLLILTNAHVVGSDQSVKLEARFSDRIQSAKVLNANAKVDLALLDPELAPSSYADLYIIAQNTFSVCTKQADSSCHEFPVASDSPSIAPDKIMTFDGQSIQSMGSQDSMAARKIEDQYISGTYPYLWAVRSLTKSGVSGGSYYQGNRFEGLVTKVPLGMQSQTLAIPAEGISAEIKAKRLQEPAIDRTQMQKSLENGRAAYSGGDLGNGGDSINSPSSSWTLHDVGPWFANANSNRSLDRRIADPFADVGLNSAISLNGTSTLILEQHNVFQGYLFQAATLARWSYLQGHGASVTPLPSGAPQLAQLQKLRVASPMKFRFVRVWTKDTETHFSLKYLLEGDFHDGVFSLFDRGSKEGYRIMDTITPPLIVAATGQEVWLQLAFQDENFRMSLYQGLQHLMVEDLATSQKFDLQARPDMNSTKHFFTSSDGSYRAVVIYNEADLTRAESLLVETPTRLFEITYTQPNLGFVR